MGSCACRRDIRAGMNSIDCKSQFLGASLCLLQLVFLQMKGYLPSIGQSSRGEGAHSRGELAVRPPCLHEQSLASSSLIQLTRRTIRRSWPMMAIEASFALTVVASSLTDLLVKSDYSAYSD